MSDMNRRLQQAARRMADQQTSRLAEIPEGTHLRATVTAVVPGGADDGNALVTVLYRGAELPVADYPDSYTPAVGHRVLCVLAQSQLSILHRGIGVTIIPA